MPDSRTHLELVVPAPLAGQRLDHALDALIPDVSRSRLQKMVRRGQVWLRGKQVTRSNLTVATGDPIQVAMQGARGPLREPLALLHVDEHVLVVDKPAGMLSHATERHRGGSVAEQMAREHGPLPLGMGEDRPGIVHRLDRDTSGLMVLARHEDAMEHLRAQFRSREVKKTYLALVHGAPPSSDGVVELALGPAEGEPDRQQVREDGKEARTRWDVAERFGQQTLLRCHPETGRRHQIRVHLNALGLPIVGDKLYRAPKTLQLPVQAPVIARQALHAHRLVFRHPASGEALAFESPLPRDLAALVEFLREH